MNIRQFVRRHRDEWKQLEQYTVHLEKKGRKVTGADVTTFQQLYQRAAQHLSYSQTYYPGEEVTEYLNGLVSKSHNLLYKSQVSSFQQIRYFFSTKFIGLLLEQWKFIVIAMLLFLLGGLASFLSIVNDPLHFYSIMPDEMSAGIDPERLGEGHDVIDSSLMSAEIMTNNIQVAILAFASGITFGLLTVYVLVYNGLIVGGIAAVYWHAGMSYEFWAYIVPHGMIELTAIFIAGGAGLLMGYKLFVPGSFSRGFQLKENAKRSVQLFLGTIPLFIVAGVIEGFITPSQLSLEVKYIVAGVTVLALVLYMISGKLLLDKRDTVES
ncbi:stage II sporulation protein M [Virgibacillus sp. MSJ-26]|uniref:stage II sporulation protein M n=1 Tax=Virgibacillus sp. MSJ-26 TaxID=2841522 RepID=UPI001C11AF7B|nr:stage II sporulation protein M [Virgibacillus sp. MSJ-26]MBU5466136.1 stage II sporulation protein M [Virgibacillus sp. MSJ-26]